ncbi:hypothetical protein [Nocardia sp. R6R-6]|uniref:hypothetical protein n=1 Tax=Nocardia sp. R6R-6 TaxID=3459303 RepID=UPI00403E117D
MRNRLELSGELFRVGIVAALFAIELLTDPPACCGSGGAARVGATRVNRLMTSAATFSDDREPGRRAHRSRPVALDSAQEFLTRARNGLV